MNTRRLVLGIGINDYEEKMKINGRNIKSYDVWRNMLQRCYSSKYQIKNPTYIGCSVCDEWKHFSKFKQWCDANYREGFQLDKDILNEGNNIYSPDTCVFVPQYLNLLFTDRRNNRGNLPLGVSRHGKIYVASCNDGYGKLLTKTFKTVEEAQNWYSATKKRVVAEQVQRALDEGAIDQRIADALTRREF